MDTICFSNALLEMKRGARVARCGWNGKGMWLEVQATTELSKMTLPYIYMHTAHQDNVPWVASQTDLLSEDWFVLPEKV